MTPSLPSFRGLSSEKIPFPRFRLELRRRLRRLGPTALRRPDRRPGAEIMDSSLPKILAPRRASLPWASGGQRVGRLWLRRGAAVDMGQTLDGALDWVSLPCAE